MVEPHYVKGESMSDEQTSEEIEAAGELDDEGAGPSEGEETEESSESEGGEA